MGAVIVVALTLLLIATGPAAAQQNFGGEFVSRDNASVSVAHAWVDAALFAIRKDFARPTVHARYLYHLSVAMYDAWAAYDDVASPLWLRPEARFEQCRIAAHPVARANSDTKVDIERRAEVGQRAWARAHALIDGAPDPDPPAIDAEPAPARSTGTSGCSATGDRRAGLWPSWLVLIAWSAIRGGHGQSLRRRTR